MPPTHNLTTVMTPIGALKPHPDNPRNGDTDAIAQSLQVNGQYRPIVATDDGTILAGNHTYAAAMELGWDEIATVTLTVDPHSAEAHRIMLADNRTADLGRYDDGLLLTLLRTLEEEVGLEGSGFDQDGLEHLAHLVDEFNDDAIPKQRPARRTTPFDLIWSAADPYTSLFAHLAGWGQGYISTTLPRQFESLLIICERMKEKPTLTFVDNDYHDYDHDYHVTTIMEGPSPKYATVRDLMTKQQCDDAGITYYTLDEVVEQGADVAEAGAEHVILIPKYDCLSDLPRTISDTPVVLGYSVPSSYGRTNLAPERFAGWPVHLLGGSWTVQRSILAILGDDVVSLDNNYLMKQAMFGSVQLPERTASLDEMMDGIMVARGLPVLAAAVSQAACYADALSFGGQTVKDPAPAPDPTVKEER